MWERGGRSHRRYLNGAATRTLYGQYWPALCDEVCPDVLGDCAQRGRGGRDLVFKPSGARASIVPKKRAVSLQARSSAHTKSPARTHSYLLRVQARCDVDLGQSEDMVDTYAVAIWHLWGKVAGDDDALVVDDWAIVNGWARLRVPQGQAT